MTMTIGAGERKIIDHLALSATNRKDENKREEKEIKERKYSLVCQLILLLIINLWQEAFGFTVTLCLSPGQFSSNLRQSYTTTVLKLYPSQMGKKLPMLEVFTCSWKVD